MSSCSNLRNLKGSTIKLVSGSELLRQEISNLTYHPFTITSAPHQNYLTAHIRAVGPWTRKLHEIYNPNLPKPPLLIDGPFGSSSENWHSFENLIFIAAGIGVTPVASILKDFVHRVKSDLDFKLQKFIFFWVCRTQKQFEWFVDLLRETEQEDLQQRLEVHIFITELNQKFDLRTIMLYICEKQFHKLHKASLFTGLQASTHFGRPDFVDLFAQIKSSVTTDTMAVFSCTPKNMIDDIIEACNIVSNSPGTQFRHYDESFL